MLLSNTNRHDSIPWQYTSPPRTTAASSVSRVHGPASPQLGHARVWSCISEPTLARLLLLGSRPCRALPFTKLLLMQLLTLPKKELHYLRCSCTVTCPVNGQWRDCASPTSKSTVLSGHCSGGGWQKAHSVALTLGTSQRRLSLTTLRTYTALVKHLLRPWQTCLPLPSKDTNCVPSYLKSS